MTTFIVLLKGINVGGHRKLPMSELRSILESIGFINPRTYIQSGNVVLTSEHNDKNYVERMVSQAIHDKFGFEVMIIAMTRSDLESVFDRCPFPEEKKKRSYFMLLHKAPTKAMIASVSEKIYPGELYQIIGTCIYYFSDVPFGRSKFNVNFFERHLNTFATSRNYNTILKLLSLSAE